tara:strand:+ start:680 stop:1042 length:363 start_codon:yes stop_codon:yes gene_type:complete
MDLQAATVGPLTVDPGERVKVATGIAIALPPGYEAQIRPRSGLALEHGITVLNAIGTIDSDYRGEIGVLLINHGDKKFVIKRGMRIAQIVFAKVHLADWKEVAQLPESTRNKGGFGSTGT